MDAHRESLDVNVLVEQVEPLRRLARRLVWQSADADDLVQDAALAALESGARAQQPAAWLRGVVRLLALKRGSTAARHERLARKLPPPSSPPSPRQVMETLELQRRLATLLMELGEPYRTAVHMRYFQDRPPREIASVLGLPLHTVKTHLSRGMERLRRKLDADHGGSRTTWQLTLAHLAGARPGAAAAAGLTAASVTAKWVLVAASLLLVTLACWLLAGDFFHSDQDTDTPVLSADTDRDASTKTEGARLRGRATELQEGRAESDNEVTGTTPRASEASGETREQPDDQAPAATSVTVVVVGEVRDPAGVPLTGATVEVYQNPYFGRRKAARLTQGISDAHGAVQLPVPLNTTNDATRQIVVTARHGDRLSATLEVTLQQGAPRPIALQLHEPLRLAVWVHDANDQPLPGVVCTACYTSMIEFVGPSGAPVTGRTDETGRALLLIPDSPSGGRFSLGGPAGFRIRARGPGFVDTYSAPIRTDVARQQSITIRAAPARNIAVHVRSEDGEPLTQHGFLLTLLREQEAGMAPLGPTRGVHTDAAGNFQIERAPLGPLLLKLGSRGFAPVTARIAEHETELILSLQRRFRATFMLVDAATKDPLTPQFMSVSTWPAGRPLPSAVEQLVEGRIDVAGLAPGAYTLRVHVAGRWGAHVHRFEMAAKNPSTDTIPVPAPQGRRVDLLVRTSEGAPLVDAVCHLGLASEFVPTRDPPFSIARCVRVKTDSSGRAHALGLPSGSYKLHTRCSDDRTRVTPVTIDEPAGHAIAVDVRFDPGATLILPTPEAYRTAGLHFRPQVVTADGTRHFPTVADSGEQPVLRLQDLPGGTCTVIPETSDFETHPFTGDPYAVRIDLTPGQVSIPTWPALHTARVKLVVREGDGSPFEGTWFALLRVGSGVDEKTIRRHRYLSRKRFLLGDDGVHVARGLLPGNYYVVVFGKKHRMHRFEVTGAAEQTIVVPQ